MDVLLIYSTRERFCFHHGQNRKLHALPPPSAIKNDVIMRSWQDNWIRLLPQKFQGTQEFCTFWHYKKGKWSIWIKYLRHHLASFKCMPQDLSTPHHNIIVMMLWGLEGAASLVSNRENNNYVVTTLISYNRKFSQGPNFCDFRDPRPKHEDKNREITTKIWTCELWCEHLDSWKFSHMHYDYGTALLMTSYRLSQ